MPDGEQRRRTTDRTGPLWTVLQCLVLAAFCCAVALIVLLVGMVLLSLTGLSFDPHGYVRIFGIVVAVPLGVVAMLLWPLYRWLRRGSGTDGRSGAATDRR
jgi:uncharacterized BrkB/YihY/UPF0761 family membrane protein